jgi:hypothetical protein
MEAPLPVNTMRRTKSLPRAVAALLLCSLVLGNAPAFAADEKLSCVRASDKASSLRTDGKMLASREQLLVCAREVCPAPVRKDCTRRLGDLEDALPSIVIAAKDAGGHDLIDVRTTIDGNVLGEKLDGKAITVDPGTHAFKFEHGTDPPVEEQVLVAEGVKNRVVTVTFTAPRTKDATEGPGGARKEKAGVPVASWVLGGVGIVALGSFAYFGLSSRGRADELRTTCAPGCDGSDVDSLKTRIRIADASLGVGVVALGAAVLVWVLSPGPADGREHAKAGVQVGIAPILGGGALQIGGVFR